jgi:hypothetical protein
MPKPKKRVVKKKQPLQKQKQSQIVNINLAKTKATRRGKTSNKPQIKPVSTPVSVSTPVYIQYPSFALPSYQPSIIPSPAPTPAPASISSVPTSSVPTSSLLAGLAVAPRVAAAATTATGSVLLSAIEPSVVERVNPFVRYADEEIQRLLNRDRDLIEEQFFDVEEDAQLEPAPVRQPAPVQRQREGVDVLTDEEGEPIRIQSEVQTAQPFIQSEPQPDIFNLEQPPEELPYTASQFEDLRQKTLVGRSLEKSQFPLLGTPFVEPISVVETNEPLTFATSEETKPLTFATSEETKPLTFATSEETKPKPQKKKVVSKATVEEVPQLTAKQYLAKQRKEEEKQQKVELKKQKASPAKLPLGFSPEEEAPKPNPFGFEPAPKKAVGGLQRRREPEEEPLQYGFSN